MALDISLAPAEITSALVASIAAAMAMYRRDVMLLIISTILPGVEALSFEAWLVSY